MHFSKAVLLRSECYGSESLLCLPVLRAKFRNYTPLFDRRLHFFIQRGGCYDLLLYSTVVTNR